MMNTIHGGPTFREWQATKLPPSARRAAHNLHHDFATAVNTVVDWAIDFVDVLGQLISDLLTQIAEALQPLTDAITNTQGDNQWTVISRTHTSPIPPFRGPSPSLPRTALGLPSPIVSDARFRS